MNCNRLILYSDQTHRLALGAGSISPSPPVEDLVRAFGPASELALAQGCTSDILMILQTDLHRIVSSPLADRAFHSEKNAQALPKGPESLVNYMNVVHVFLSKLSEWEMGFSNISGKSIANYVSGLRLSNFNCRRV